MQDSGRENPHPPLITWKTRALAAPAQVGIAVSVRSLKIYLLPSHLTSQHFMADQTRHSALDDEA